VLRWLTGCVRVLELPTDPDLAPPDGPADPVAPAKICVPASTLGYSLPSPRWGLAVAYASRRLDDRPSSALRLSPSWFLATGWQTSAFGCAPYGPPWSEDPYWAGDQGCLGVREETVWNELCRLFPGEYTCEGYAGALVGDAPEASALALAWFAVAAHGLLGRFDLDPDEWYASSTDPRAVEALTATMHYRGPWAGEVATILADCPSEVAACLDWDLEAHVVGVEAKLDALDDAPCWDEPLEPEDVEAFVAALEAARPAWDWSEASAPAVEALTGAGFAVDAPRVLDAIDAAVDLRLACPEAELYTWYRLPCP
jgi:hypothetical protein